MDYFVSFRITEIIDSTGHREKQEGGAGPGAESKREEKRRGGRSRGDAERRVRGRRAASEGGEGSEELRSLRWRINQLEKEKLKLMTSCNQEVERRSWSATPPAGCLTDVRFVTQAKIRASRSIILMNLNTE